MMCSDLFSKTDVSLVFALEIRTTWENVNDH